MFFFYALTYMLVTVISNAGDYSTNHFKTFNRSIRFHDNDCVFTSSLAIRVFQIIFQDAPPPLSFNLSLSVCLSGGKSGRSESRGRE